MRKIILLITAMAIIAAPACSYMTVIGPPPPESASTTYGGPGNVVARSVPDCTTSKIAPLLDTVIAAMFIPSGVVFGGAGVVALFVGDKNQNDDSNNPGDNAAAAFLALGLVTVLIGLPWALSARSGFRDVNACRAAYAQRSY